MAKDTEIAISDPELDSLMAELEAETGGAVAQPEKVVAKTPEAIEPEGVSDEELEAAAAAETATAPAAAPTPAPTTPPLPRGKDPLAEEESNFVLPEHLTRPAPEEVEEPAPVGKPALKVVASTPPQVAAAPVAANEPETDPNKPPKPRAALRYGINVAEFNRETGVSEINLDDCMMQQSSLRAYYGEQAALAEAQASRLKKRFEVKEAILYDEARKKMALTSEKVTEKAVENAVKRDPSWLRMTEMVIEAESIAAINKSLVRSLDDRRDMVIQLGADRRDGMRGQARVMADRELRERAIAAGRPPAAAT